MIDLKVNAKGRGNYKLGLLRFKEPDWGSLQEGTKFPRTCSHSFASLSYKVTIHFLNTITLKD